MPDVNVQFKKGLESAYQAMKTAGTLDDLQFYYTTDEKNLYQGEHKLNSAEDLAAALTLLNNTEATSGSIRYIIKNEYIAGLDGVITGDGKFATQLSESDGVVSAVMVDLTASDIPTLTLSKISDAGTAAAADVATTAIQEESTDDGLVSAAQVAAFVATEIADLEGAMHFAGVVTRQEGETDAQAIARVVPSPEAGDTVVMSDNAKEYIYTGTEWREVGDEGLYVQKSTTIAGVNLEDNITKTELLTALNVEDGAEVNTIEGVQVNGTDLTPDANDKVNVTIAEGATDGTVAVNGTDVAVHGLDSAAYAATTDFDAAGAADAVLGTSGDAATANTVYGAKAAAAAAQSDVDDLETYVGEIPSGSSATDIVGYVDEKSAAANIVWGSF